MSDDQIYVAFAVAPASVAEEVSMGAKKRTPLLTPEQNATYIYQLVFFYQMNAVGRAAEIEGAHVAALIEDDNFDGTIRDGLTPAHGYRYLWGSLQSNIGVRLCRSAGT